MLDGAVKINEESRERECVGRHTADGLRSELNQGRCIWAPAQLVS